MLIDRHVAAERRAGWRDDIRDVDPVARLAPVAEDGRRAAVEQLAAEDRDDARLPVDILAPPVDVAVAQRDGREPEEARVQPEIALGRELALAVRRQRADRVILGGRQQIGVAIQSATGGAVDEPPRAWARPPRAR